MSYQLSGTSVLVAGAGLAGLTAAYELAAMGAVVTVVDARDRVGGRVWTMRNFADGQHAEAGGDMIDDSHQEVRALASRLGLSLARVLRNGWGYVRPDGRGRVRPVRPTSHSGWSRLAAHLAPLVELYRLTERNWESPIVKELARRSVSEWLRQVQADSELRDTALGLRGFFLADPDELSLLALIDQFSADEALVPERTFRIEGGNDRLTASMAAALGERVHLQTELVAVAHRGKKVRATLRRTRQTAQLDADYLVFALPATLLRRIPITPALPAQQHEALARLSYGRATKTLLQFSRRFWRVPGRPSAFGSTLPIGAVWDAAGEQRGAPGILALLAGGTASVATDQLLTTSGPEGLAASLTWLGSDRAELLSAEHVSWTNEPWSRGGYAFFDPGFSPDLRPWLARPSGRLFFAGEHTSLQWQGYMNGAIESGRRAAFEVGATRAAG